jgi:hypothetical protein
MTKINPGSTIIGASGKKLIVEREARHQGGRVEGNTIYSGDLKILKSAVVRVIPPISRFKLGDRAKYIGSDFNLKTQYVGVLEVWEISTKDIGSYACLKPTGRVTSWIEFADLQLVEVV